MLRRATGRKGTALRIVCPWNPNSGYAKVVYIGLAVGRESDRSGHWSQIRV